MSAVEHLAKAIRDHRRCVGLTQDALARRAGLSVRTVRAIETGRQDNPQLVTVHLIADALGMPATELTRLLGAAFGARGSTRAVLPRQLPARPRHFVGRTAQLAQLDAALDGVPVCLTGIGGIGKTSLALRWAYANLARFPDGQLFVDLHGFDQDTDPTSPESALRGLLHGLGADLAAAPADLDGLLGLYRSLVADKRLLIVIDNVADAAAVVPLLPAGPFGAVLITSRVWLPTLVAEHDARQVTVPLLAAADARALLVQRLGNAAADEPQAVDDLLASCFGLPLALSIVAGQARSSPGMPLRNLVADIRSSGPLDEGSRGIAAALSCSFRELPPEQSRMVRLLGIAPGPNIAASSAAVLAGLPVGRTRPVLRALERASLLEQEANGRYRMHDLVRDHAVRMPDADAAAAVRRLVDFAVHTAYQGGGLVAPSRPPLSPGPTPTTTSAPFTDADGAMAWFAAEHACLLALQQTAFERGWYTAAWQLGWSLNRFHYLTGNLSADVAVARMAVDAAQRLDDAAALVATLRQYGLALARTGRGDEGLAQLRRAIEVAEQLPDRVPLAGVHHALTVVQGLRDENDQALWHAITACELYREAELVNQEADTLNSVGWYAARCGDYGMARVHCEAALALHRLSGDVGSEAIVLDSLGYIAHHSGKLAEAVERYRGALTLLEVAGDAFQHAETEECLGVTYLDLERFGDARAAWQSALDDCQAQGRVKAVARIRGRLDALPMRR